MPVKMCCLSCTLPLLKTSCLSQVKEITDNICRIQYKGPPTIGTGITAAIKSQFPDITEVIML